MKSKLIILLLLSVSAVNFAFRRDISHISSADTTDSVCIVEEMLDTIYRGWYRSNVLDTNNTMLELFLGPLDADAECIGTFVEKNRYCTIHGEWGIYLYGITECYQMVSMYINDTVEGSNYMHYDGDEESPVWRKTMYFYTKNDTASHHYIEIKDRMGASILIRSITITDSSDKPIVYRPMDIFDSVTRYEIPPNARYISVSGADPSVTESYCTYDKDSGDVTFVVLPTINGGNMWMKNGEILYYPYDSMCRLDSANMIRLQPIKESSFITPRP